MAVDIGPFQRIVRINWATGNAVAVLFVGWVMNATNTGGADPSLNVEQAIAINSDINPITGPIGDDFIPPQIKLKRDGVVGPAPAIGPVVTSDLLRYYKIWSLPTYVHAGDITHSTGGGYYFITTDFATFPDFVFSPYASVEAADDYLAAQLALHPEYAGGTGTITFLPPFDNTQQDLTWRAVVFLNLAALPKKNDGSIDVNLSYILSGAGTPSGTYTILGLLFLQGLGLTLTIDPTLTTAGLGLDRAPNAGYNYSEHGSWSDLGPGTTVNVTGTLNITLLPPAITGPASPGGGGGG